jgi:hypothetical protein
MFHIEYENCRDKFQDYVQVFERLLQERKAIKLNCEQAEVFYETQYQDANIVVEVRFIRWKYLLLVLFLLGLYQFWG